MPLEKGSGSQVIGHNISEMEQSGHPHAQAVAAALHTAYDKPNMEPNYNPASDKRNNWY